MWEYLIYFLSENTVLNLCLLLTNVFMNTNSISIKHQAVLNSDKQVQIAFCSDLEMVVLCCVLPLTHCGLVRPYGDKNLGQHWPR